MYIVATFASQQRARYAAQQSRRKYPSSRGKYDAVDKDVMTRSGLTPAQYDALLPEAKKKVFEKYQKGTLTTTSYARSTAQYQLPNGETTNFEGAQAYEREQKAAAIREQTRAMLDYAQETGASKVTAKDGYLYAVQRPQKPVDRSKSPYKVSPDAAPTQRYGFAAPGLQLASEKVFGIKSVEDSYTFSTTRAPAPRLKTAGERAKAFFSRRPGETVTVNRKTTINTPAGGYMFATLNSTPAAPLNPLAGRGATFSYEPQVYTTAKESRLAWAIRRVDEGYYAVPVVNKGLALVGRAGARLEASGRRSNRGLDIAAGYALKRAGESPGSALFAAGAVAVAFTPAGGTVARQVLVPVVGGVVGSKFTLGLSSSPIKQQFGGNSRFYGAVDATPVGGKTYLGGFVPGWSAVKASVGLREFKLNVRGNLLMAGYSGADLDAAVNAAVVEKRARQKSFIVGSIIGAEGLGNAVGGAGEMLFKRASLRAGRSLAKSTVRATTLGFGLGGVAEGFAGSVSYDIANRQPISVKRGLFSAAVGGVTAGSAGYVFGKGVTTRGWRGAVRRGAVRVLDQPQEFLGDVTTNFLGGKYRFSPVVAPSASFSPGGRKSRTYDITATQVVTRSASVPQPSSFSVVAFSPSATTAVRSGRALTVSQSRGFAPSLSLSQSRAVAPARSFAPVRSSSFAPSLVPSLAQSRALAVAPSVSPSISNSFSLSQAFAPSFATANVPTITKFPFFILPGQLGGGRGRGRGRTGGRRQYRYAPSLAAIDLRIRGGGRTPAGGFTGFEFRGLPGLTRRRKAKRRKK